MSGPVEGSLCVDCRCLNSNPISLAAIASLFKSKVSFLGSLVQALLQVELSGELRYVEL